MGRERNATLLWGLLLAVYWSILLVSAVVSLTSELPRGYLVILLVSGVPLYFVTSQAIIRQYDEPPAEDVEAPELARILLFPVRPGDDVPGDIDKAA